MSLRHKQGKAVGKKERIRKRKGGENEEALVLPWSKTMKSLFWSTFWKGPFILFFPCTPHTFYHLPLHFPHKVTQKMIFLRSTQRSLQGLGPLSTQVSNKEAPLRVVGSGTSYKMILKKSPKPGLGIHWVPELLKTPVHTTEPQFTALNLFHNWLWKLRCVCMIPE